jgi:ferredoxin
MRRRGVPADTPPLSSFFGLSARPGLREDPSLMAHIVAEPCFDCKYTDCVVVCPVDCFYEGPQMLYIHPEECIDCEACVPECPVEAIFHEDNLPDEWKNYIEMNRDESTKYPVITEKKDALEAEKCDKSRKKH